MRFTLCALNSLCLLILPVVVAGFGLSMGAAAGLLVMIPLRRCSTKARGCSNR